MATDEIQTTTQDPAAVPQEEEDRVDPLIIDVVGTDLLSLSRETGLEKLTELYTKTKWADEEEAAQKFAEVAHDINKKYQVDEPFSLDSDAVAISRRILDETITEDEKLAAVEDWRTDAKRRLYGSKDPKKLITGVNQERVIDMYATQLRRGIVGQDVGWIQDKIVRGIDAISSPIFGVTDTALKGLGYETSLQKPIREYLGEHTNPEDDEAISSKAATALGTIGGFAGSTLGGPIGVYSYLGATIVDQGKQVYDTAFEETKSQESAKDALLRATPGILLGSFADKMLGGTLGNLMKGVTKGVGTVTGAAAGAIGAGVQLATTGEALSKATGNPQYKPRPEELAKEALVFGAIGGVIGAAHDVGNAYDQARFNAIKKQLRERFSNKDETAPAEVSDNGAVKTTDLNDVYADNRKEADEYLGSYVSKEEPVPTNEEVKAKAAAEGVTSVRGPKGAEGQPEFFTLKEKTSTIENDFPDDTGAPPKVEENIPPINELSKEPGVVDKGQDVRVGEEGVAKDFGTKSEDTIIAEEYVPTPALNKLMDTIGVIYGAFKRVNPNLKEADWLGAYFTSLNRIGIRKRVFQDLNEARKTMAHEVGHAISYMRYHSEKHKDLWAALHFKPDIAALKEVLVNYDKTLASKFNDQVVYDEASQLSAKWRNWGQAWTGVEKDGYRNTVAEVQADTMSAIFNNPEMVKRNYPNVWAAFEEGLEANPTLKQFWNDMVKHQTDPTALDKYFSDKFQAAREREVDDLNRNADDSFKAELQEKKDAPKKGVQEFVSRFGNRFAWGREIVEKLSPTLRQKGDQLYNKLYSFVTGYQRIRANLDAPLNHLVRKFFREKDFGNTPKEAQANWQDYEANNRVLQEKTEVMADIENDSARYVKALNDFAAKVDPKVQARFGLSNYAKLTGKDLVTEIAAFQAQFSPKQLKLLADQAVKFNNAEAAEIFQADAFNVRGLMANPDMNPKTALQKMSLLKSKLGEKGFAKLQKYSEDFHNIVGNYLYKVMDESGKFTPRTMRRLRLNKNNYVTFNVLKYFDGDPHFSAAIKMQTGTMEQIGNVIPDTIYKARAIAVVAERQKAINSAIELARLGNYKVEEVDTHKFPNQGKTKWELRDLLAARHPENSYVIGYENGIGTLYQIDSPRFSNMFAQSMLAKNKMLSPVLEMLEAYHKATLARETKVTLSIPYILRAKFWDRATESILARSWNPFDVIPFLRSGKRRSIDKRALEAANLFREGELTPATKDLVDENALSLHLASDFGGVEDVKIKPENAFYEAMGKPIPGEDNLRTSVKVNRWLNNALDKLQLGKVREIAERDEVRTKVAAYMIAREMRGMTKEQAAMVAREWAGTPDPLGGGTEASAVNKLFLFGRAQINGMRAIYNQFKDDPKGFGAQYFMRKGLPRLMVSSAFMAPIIGALFGEEDGKVAGLFLDKISEFDKLSKIIIPLGFTDEKGNFKGFNVRSEEVAADWKAAYLRLPTSKELVIIDQINSIWFKPLEDLVRDGTISMKNIAQNAVKSLAAVTSGNLSPAIQTGFQSLQLMGGYNPYDFYRKRGVLTKDVQEAGSFAQKFTDFAVWSFVQNAPGYFTYRNDIQSSTETESPFDYIAKVPIAGSILRSFVGNSNYGDFERSAELSNKKAALDSEIRLHLGDNSKKLYNEYVKAQSTITRLGKGWGEQVSPSQRTRIHQLLNWHTRAYRHAFNELRAYYEKGDEEQIKSMSDSLESSSTAYLNSLK